MLSNSSVVLSLNKMYMYTWYDFFHVSDARKETLHTNTAVYTGFYKNLTPIHCDPFWSLFLSHTFIQTIISAYMTVGSLYVSYLPNLWDSQLPD